MKTPVPVPRAENLQRFVDALRAAFDEAVADDPARVHLVERGFESLERPREIVGTVPSGLATVRHLEAAVSRVESIAHARGRASTIEATPDRGSRLWRESGRASPATSASLARALAALAPSFAWYRRLGSETLEPAFRDGHANAFVIGPGGLEDAPGTAVGVSLVAPGVRYPDHHHAPEELYLVLSPGDWKHGASDWFTPGIGGVVHNVPDVVHAMRAGDAPLLAIWCLLP